MATLREHVEQTQQMAAVVGATLDEGEDWIPVMIGVTEDGRVAIAGMLAGKEQWTDIAAHFVRTERLRMLSMILSSWRSIATGPAERDRIIAEGGPHNDPRRAEVLIVAGATPGQQIITEAPILRPPGHGPRLGEWHDWDATEVTGDLAGMLTAGFDVGPVQ